MRGFRVMAESAQALQQGFRHHPQCAVELNIGVDVVNGTGSTSKTPSYTKSVSWHHYPDNLGILPLNQAVTLFFHNLYL